MARILVALCAALALAAGSSTFASASGDDRLCDYMASAARKFPHPRVDRPPVEEQVPAEEVLPGDDTAGGTDEEATVAEPGPGDDTGPSAEGDVGAEVDLGAEDELAPEEIFGAVESDAPEAACAYSEARHEESGGTRRGGRGPDRFIGDGGVNRFFGGEGDDYLDGAGGRDELRAGPGDDVLITGAVPRRPRASRGKRARVARVSRRGDYANGARGDDTIHARNGRADAISCGGGRDTVFAERGDSTTRNCEIVRYG